MQVVGQYFTLGIERTTRFQIRRPGEETSDKRQEQTQGSNTATKTSSNLNENQDEQPLLHPENVMNDTEEHDNNINGTDSLEIGESNSNETSSEDGLLGESSEETNETSSEGISSSDEQDIWNDTQSTNTSKILHEITVKDKDENYIQGEAKNGSSVQKRSVFGQKYKALHEHLKRNIEDKNNVRDKRETTNSEKTKIKENGEEEEDSDSDEEEDDEEEGEKDENKTVEELDLVIKLRGIR